MATMVLLLWPAITIALFASLGPARGLIWSVAVGYLFLPEGHVAFRPPIVRYDKPFVLAFSPFLATLIYFGKAYYPDYRDVNRALGKMLLILMLMLVVVVPIGTFVTNPETLFNGPVVRPGLIINDLLADMAELLIRFTPLLLAARLLVKPEHHRHLLIAILVLGFVYSFLTLFERRMAPQLNLWIYGYFPHNWLQHVRGGGYRPLVFLRHGLWLGFFLLTVFIAALALSRDKEVKLRALLPFFALWMLAVVFLSRNLGVVMLALVFAPVLLLLSFRMHVRIAAVLACVLLIYPSVHDAMDVPMSRFLDFVSTISEKRVQSFQTRLDNETELLERAKEKPVFGWGGWGRMLVINEEGRDRSLVDGLWIRQIGRHGWTGYIAFFGVLALPCVFAMRAARRKPVTPAIAGMMICMAANFIYVIPNSTP